MTIELKLTWLATNMNDKSWVNGNRCKIDLFGSEVIRFDGEDNRMQWEARTHSLNSLEGMIVLRPGIDQIIPWAMV